MKYNVGDTVMVRDNLEVGEVYGDCEFVKEMQEFRGKIMAIEKTYDYSYHLHGGGTWHFTDEMLDDVESGVMMIKIYQDGNKIIAKKDGKFGIAKCSPEDEFDIFTGAKLAIERLEKKCRPYGWLKLDVEYYYPNLSYFRLYDSKYWQGDELDEKRKERGLVFKTKEEAIEAAKKMLEVLKE